MASSLWAGLEVSGSFIHACLSSQSSPNPAPQLARTRPPPPHIYTPPPPPFQLPPVYLLLRVGWASMTLLALSSFVVPYVDRLADHGKLLASPPQKAPAAARGGARTSALARALDAFLHRCTVRTCVVPVRPLVYWYPIYNQASNQSINQPYIHHTPGAQALVLALLCLRLPLERPPPVGPPHPEPARSPPALIVFFITKAIASRPRGPRTA